jgi:hypothetical protein
MNIWSSRECTVATYTPEIITSDGMYLTRNYLSTIWGSNVTDAPISITSSSNWQSFFGTNKLRSYPSYFSFINYEHIILDTDYENYAITYGCDNYFGLFHGRWATFMTRIDYAESEYVEIAKKKMRDIQYDYNFWSV